MTQEPVINATAVYNALPTSSVGTDFIAPVVNAFIASGEPRRP